MEESSNRTLKLVLSLIAMLLALAIAFYMGRATAPTVDSSELPSTIDSAQSEEPDDTTPNTEAPLGPNEPTYAESVTDDNLLQLLHDQPRREEGDPRALGNIDAPVVMVAYEDFSCPMCTKFFLETFPHLADYVDRGDLRIEFHDLVIFPNYGSDIAAHASRAAAEQGKFWEFVQKAYVEAGAGHPQYTEETVVELAQAVGITDIDTFTATLNSDQVREDVNAESTHAMQSVGVQGTPFFIINNAAISGALPTGYITNTIDQQLIEAGK